jgi:hypothetical protein
VASLLCPAHWWDWLEGWAHLDYGIEDLHVPFQYDNHRIVRFPNGSLEISDREL